MIMPNIFPGKRGKHIDRRNDLLPKRCNIYDVRRCNDYCYPTSVRIDTATHIWPTVHGDCITGSTIYTDIS